MHTRASKKRKSDSSTNKGTPSQEAHAIKRDVKKRVKGNLSGLLHLPLDVLFEIFGHLKPFDLLKVARTSKEFRRQLMSKTSTMVWKTALENIPDLPTCPTDMSEPAWVNLLFDAHCHLCINGTARTVEWMLRLRICVKCSKEKMKDIFSPSSIVHTEDYVDFPVETLLPSARGARLATRRVLIRELDEICETYSSLPDRDARISFVNDRRQILSSIQAHSKLCESWAQDQHNGRSTELSRLKLERYDAIVEKLEALGYAADIAGIRRPHSLHTQEHVRKAQRLTARVWDNIQTPVIAFMDKMRALRLKREHAALVLQRKTSAVAVFRQFIAEHHPYTDVISSGLDFCAFPPVKAILEEPTEVSVSEATFAEVVSLIPEFIDGWRGSLDSHLLQVLKDAMRSDGAEKNDCYYLGEICYNSFGEFSLDPEGDNNSDNVHNGRDNSNDDDSGSSDHDIVANRSRSSLTRSPSPWEPLPDESILLPRLKLATTVFQCSKCVSKTINVLDPNDSDDSDYPDDQGEEGWGYFGFNEEYHLKNSKTIPRPCALFYPKVKGHLCLSRTNMSQTNNWPFEDDMEENDPPATEPARILDGTTVKRRTWSTFPLRINTRLGKCVRGLVEKAGLDPETTTADDMDALNCWFACIRCAYQCNGRKQKDGCAFEMPTFTWRPALEHFGLEHHKTEASWTKIDAENIDDAVQAFESHPKSSHNMPELIGSCIPEIQEIPHPPDATWSCVYCRDTSTEPNPTSMADITIHLEEKHQIERPEQDRDYYKDFAAQMPTARQRKVVLLLKGKEAQEAQKTKLKAPKISPPTT